MAAGPPQHTRRLPRSPLITTTGRVTVVLQTIDGAR
ncbi:hypothetical protein MPTA5024_03710 [Microbispora sp. ATCC PTA-5024]|nr:hypothetical protein MPTA5024_03710 [Microbispora sp. ATCC PTA-5024]